MSDSLFTKYLRSPIFWVFFGIVCFPLVCYYTEMMTWYAIKQFSIENELFVPTVYYGWGAKAGVLIGVPLGLVSAWCARKWRNGRFVQSRALALFGGVFIGGAWLIWVLKRMAPEGFGRRIWVYCAVSVVGNLPDNLRDLCPGR